MVGLAFETLDADGSGVVELEDIRGVFDASAHPDFIGGERTEEEILLEFLSGFDVGDVKDGKV